MSLSVSNSLQKFHQVSASPKRPSLDERLEKELGIKMQPDFSRPPPGYLPALAPQQQKQQQLQEPFPVAAHLQKGCPGPYLDKVSGSAGRPW